MLSIKCGLCKAELTIPGALLFSPPDEFSGCHKWHICQPCFHAKILPAFSRNNPVEPKPKRIFQPL